MAYVEPANFESVSPKSRQEWNSQVERHGRMTNMKMTLAHDETAFAALMIWYPLRDRVAEFTGNRASLLFAQAISVGTDCLICSTFFRRLLQLAGENPDHLQMDSAEELLVQYGRGIAQGKVDDSVMEKLKATYKPSELVALTAFGSMMYATNLFNNVLQVKLDDYLEPFRAGMLKK